MAAVPAPNSRTPLLAAHHSSRHHQPSSGSSSHTSPASRQSRSTSPHAYASEDSQILIWDTARLERSVSAKARLLYRMDAPITSVCRIENTHCLAVAAEDGQLHVVRVHVSGGSSAKYSRIECIRTWAAERTIGHVVSVSHLQGELQCPWIQEQTRLRQSLRFW